MWPSVTPEKQTKLTDTQKKKKSQKMKWPNGKLSHSNHLPLTESGPEEESNSPAPGVTSKVSPEGRVTGKK